MPDRTRPERDRAGISPQTVVAMLRVFIGVVWFSNGLAKVVGVSQVRVPGFAFSVIDQSSARSILHAATRSSRVPVMSAFYRGVVLANWPVFAVLLTAAEVSIGIGLILGLATRLAALGGLVLITPIWVMLLPAGTYLWEYPADLVPLLLLALTAGGRTAGLDRTLSQRVRDGWPF